MQSSHRIGLVGGIGAALMASIGSALAAYGPRAAAPVRRAPPVPVRRSAWSSKLNRSVVVYPGQTDAQRDYMVKRAEAKRSRRAINCTYNAKRSAEGYHPWSQLQGLRATVAELNAKLD